ncbi:unnamed protein product, partial [Sphagnum balticum]
INPRRWAYGPGFRDPVRAGDRRGAGLDGVAGDRRGEASRANPAGLSALAESYDVVPPGGSSPSPEVAIWAFGQVARSLGTGAQAGRAGDDRPDRGQPGARIARPGGSVAPARFALAADPDAPRPGARRDRPRDPLPRRSVRRGSACSRADGSEMVDG